MQTGRHALAPKTIIIILLCVIVVLFLGHQHTRPQSASNSNSGLILGQLAHAPKKANDSSVIGTLNAMLEMISSHAETTGQVDSSYWNSMGMIAEVPQEVQDWLYYADDSSVRTICEVGFNAGHSAAVFLTASQQATLHVFDIMTLPYSASQVQLFKRIYKERFNIYRGSSFDLLPWFTSRRQKCDLFSVDGDHSYEGAITDFWNAVKLMSVGGKLVADDVSAAFPGVVAAWNWMIEQGYIRQLHCNSVRLNHIDKGWCLGQVVKVPEGSAAVPPGYKAAIKPAH